ncbi:MAG: hypothetical protein PF693_19635 [Spirochaetia bacterium]|jgi:uncharacterized protein YhaN|nr:hypothetical protein [Spirochaetia bacterium]
MKKEQFILTELTISKMPGFPQGLDKLEGLSPHINIIAGPNASGKSSTARIIQQLIWHKGTRGLVIEGSAEINGEPWEIKIDSEYIKIQHNGKDDELEGLPAVEESSRYMLALHELVKENEDDLAKEIIKQSIGGYDLDSAQENLGYSSGIRNKSASEFKTFTSTEKQFKEIRERQKELKKEEETLTELYSSKEKSQKAFKLTDLYKQVIEYLEAKLKFDQLSLRYEEFPSTLKNLTGEEYTNIEEFGKQIEDCNNAIEQATEEIKKSKELLTSLGIPEEGISELELDEIEERVHGLTDLNREIKGNEEKIEEIHTKELEALKSIDELIDPSEWEGLNLEEVRNLDKFLQDAHQILGEKEYSLSENKALEREIERIGNNVGKSEIITQGITSLGNWLKEQNSTLGIARWVMVASSFLGIVSVITTFIIGWQGLLGIVLITGLFIYVWFFDKGNQKESIIKIREQDYIKIGLEPPSKWDTESVSRQIDLLIEELKTAKLQEQINQRLINCINDLEKLQERLEPIDKTRNEWLGKLKSVPAYPAEGLKDFSSLYWFLKNSKDWQSAHTELKVLQAQNIQLQEMYDKELNKINELFVKSNADEAEDDVQAKIIFNILKKKATTHKDEAQRIVQKWEQIEEWEKQKKKNSDKLKEIYNKLDVENGDKEKIRQLIEQIDDYQRINKEHYASNMVLSEKRILLKKHSMYEEYGQSIDGLNIDQAQDQAEKLAAEAVKLDEINEKITKIETLIENIKNGHELEDVIVKKEEALTDLEQLFESNLFSITGNLINEQLKKETSEQNRPKVFKRANELLNRITNGRYELRLDGKSGPAFKAYDTVLRLGQDLNELSTGTRVQLLLAVRLAFVETQETAIKLPLLADELLANSDEERAKAIIEALVEISKEGRQIFYFTAQDDEVGKWDSFLREQSDFSYKILQLGGTKNNPMKYQADLDPFKFIQQVPSPDGQNHKEYGKEIQVEQYNILIQDSSQLHLWYLMNDISLLHVCLKRGIRTWGQLESFIRYDGKLEYMSEDIILHLNKKIKLLERFKELYRRGRPQPIDREVLEQSGAISGSFIDRVSDKLVELEGNPKELIKILRNGEISRFGQNKADDLEQYLFNEEYLDDQDPLEKEEILVQLNAFISSIDMDIPDAEGFINSILQHRHISEPEEVAN